MVVKAITKMKTGKVAGPSGIVAEMLKTSGDTGARLVADLANDMVRNGAIPSDWEDSFIINMVMLWREVTNRGLKLLVMKGIERVIEKIIRERISIDDMQFGFMPGRGTTDAIFILRQLQEKHLAKNKKWEDAKEYFLQYIPSKKEYKQTLSNNKRYQTIQSN